MAATADYRFRLSDLPDDILRRILRFVSAREGASTAVLSRRWRSLWRTSGAVNLDSRSYSPLLNHLKREVFLRDAMAALAAAAEHGPVTRLSFHMEAGHRFSMQSLVSYRREAEDNWFDEAEHNLVGEVMSNPAARNTEELRIEGVTLEDASSYHHQKGGYYKLRIDDIPYQALSVLHIVNARLELNSVSVSFPRLNALQLQGCHVSLKELRDMIHGAPLLTAGLLESIFILRSYGEDRSFRTRGCQMCGQEVTVLVLTDWSTHDMEKIGSVELDRPKLQYFRFHGVLSDQQVSLKSCAPNMTRVDFHFKDGIYKAKSLSVPFWRFLRNVNSTKVLRVKVDCPMDRIAIFDMKSLDELLDNKLLYNLERLEVEGCYDPEQNTAGKAIANLLHCCPILRHLQIKINKASHTDYYTTSDLARELQSDFDKSVKHFRRRRGTCGSNDDKYEVSDVHGLSEHIFNCLQSHLRRLSLQFCNEEDGFFQVQLLKFFADNAMVLEQVEINDGSRKMCEHLNDKFRTWALNSAERISLQKAFLESLPMYSGI